MYNFARVEPSFVWAIINIRLQQLGEYYEFMKYYNHCQASNASNQVQCRSLNDIDSCLTTVSQIAMLPPY